MWGSIQPLSEHFPFWRFGMTFFSVCKCVLRVDVIVQAEILHLKYNKSADPYVSYSLHCAFGSMAEGAKMPTSKTGSAMAVSGIFWSSKSGKGGGGDVLFI